MVHVRPMKQVVARYERGEAPVDFIELELDADGLGLSVRQAEGERRSRFESAAAARWERDREVASALARGYRPLSVAPEVELSDDELDAALRARPDDRETFLVYADWLQARGDPRGALIAAQHALLDDPESPPLRETGFADVALATPETALSDHNLLVVDLVLSRPGSG